MKLRSTLLFAAASLTASALAPVVATTSAFFAASSVALQAATAISSASTESWDYDLTDYTTPTSVNEARALITGTPDYYINGDVTKDIVVGASATTGMAITNANQGTQTLSGKVSGEGIFAVYYASSNASKTTYKFTGDLSEFSGTMYVNLFEESRVNTLTFTGTSTSAISGTGAIVSNRNIVFSKDAGDITVANSSITTNNLTFEGGASYSVLNDVTAGTLTLSAGSLVLNGNTMVSSALSAASGATLTNVGTLNLSAATVAISSAITNTGTVTISDSTNFALAGITAVDGVYTVISGGTIDGWNSETLGHSNFTIDGEAVGSRSTLDFSTAGSVKVTTNVLNLSWVGSDGAGIWNTTNTNTPWAEKDSSSSAPTQFFTNGDSVTFNSENASVVVDGIVKPDLMTVSQHTTFSGSGEIVLNAPERLTIGEGVGLSLGENVVLDLGVSNTDVSLSVSGSGKIKRVNSGGHGIATAIAGDFSGTLDYSGDLGLAGFALGEDATLRLSEVASGNGMWSNTGNTQVLENAVVFATNYAVVLGGDSITFNGNVFSEGENTITVRQGWPYKNGTLTFAGDATIATLNQSGGTSVFAGDATIATVVQSSGTLTFAGEGTVATIGSYTGPVSAASVVVNVGTESTVNVSNNFILVNENNSTRGTLNLSGNMFVGGVFWVARDGVGVANIESGGVLVTNTLKFGTEDGSWASSNATEKSSTVTVNTGGTLVIGSGGIVTQGAMNTETLNFSGGTLGTSADSLNVNLSGLNVALGDGTTSTINTGKYVDGAFSATGASITVANSISGGGSLVKAGAGTLTLSAENTFSGGLTVKAGTFVGASAGSFGSGAITLEGGTLKCASALTLSDKMVQIGGSATLENITFENSTLTFLNSGVLALGTDATLTSGTIDLSQLLFTDEANSVVLFSNGSQSLLDVINSSSVTTNVNGTYSLDNGSILFTVASEDALLVWDSDSADKTWSVTSFSGKTFTENQKVLFDTVDGEETVTVNAAVSSSHVTVNAGSTGVYDIVGSENLTASAIEVRSGTLELNGLNDAKTIGAISVSSGASLVLNSDNTGFDSITLENGSSLVIKSATEFGLAAANGSTNGAILGTGTIVFDLASTDVFGVVSNTFFNAISNAGLFTGKIQVKQGTFEIDGSYTGKMGKVTAWEVLDGGRLVITDVANAPASIGSNATITLAGSGIAEADDSTPNGALVLMQDVSVSNIFRLSGDATVYVAEGKTLTLNSTSNVDFGSNTLTLSGAGTFLWSHNGGVNYSSGLEISEGTTFADNGNYKWSLTFTDTSVLSGAGTLYSGVPTNGSGQGDGYRSVIFNGSTKDFTGTWLLENASGNGVGNRKIFGVLNSSDGIFGGVIEFYDSTSDAPDPLLISSYLSIGKDMTIGGLKGTNGTVGGSASVGGNTLTQGDAHALTVNLANGADYIFGGKIDSTISSLTISGEGTQTLSGDNTGFNGNITVSGGTLKATQLAALGSADGALAIEAAGTLEFAFGGELSRELSGTGTLAKSGAESLSITGTAFGGSFDVKEGQLSVNIQNSAFGSLNVGTGATFKTQNAADFGTVAVGAGATVQGADKNTKISLVSGTFAGTLSSATLVKTGTGVLNLSGATFGAGGSMLVESGTLAALNVATGLEVVIAEDASEVVFSDVVLSGGVFVLNGLSSTTAAASITGLGAGSTGVSLEIYGLDLETSYKLFTFDSQTAVDTWKSLNITSNLDGFGDYSWDGLTLMFTQTRSAGTLTWLAGATLWNSEAESWKTEGGTVSKFVSTSEVLFTAESLSNGLADVSINTSEKLSASSITVDVGETGRVIFSTVGDGSEDLLSSNGINVVSGALLWRMPEGVYDSVFNIGVAGTLNVQRPDGVTDFTLSNTLTGTGTILHETDSTLTLSGDRSQFTGTLDVDAGTVVLANGTGTEAFSKIDIAEGAVVSATSGTAIGDATKLTLGQVTGTGTLRVNSSVANTDGKFVVVDLSGSAFTGTVELNALDLALENNQNYTGVSPSDLANASAVRLTNGASLNFFNEAITFDKNIEVADTNGAIRVYGNNAGATISGDISGAGTLTVKDGGKLILSGAVGTANSALGGLTLASGTELEIAGENSSINVAGDVILSGDAATINTNGVIVGKLKVVGAQTAFTLGGALSVAEFEREEVGGGDGRTMSVLAGSNISVAGTATFGNNESVNIGENAEFSAQTITNTWGLSVSLGEGSTLKANALILNVPGYDRSGSFVGSGTQSSIEFGKVDLGSSASRVSFENVSVKIGSEGIVGSGEQKFIQFKDVTVSVLGDATGWTADANVKLNGGTTTFDVGEDEEIVLNGAFTEANDTTSSALIKTGAGTLVLGQGNANKGGTQVNEGVLKFTNTEGVSLGEGTYTFNGGTLAAGAGTALSVGAGTTLSGAVVYTNDRNGSLVFAADNAISGEGNSLTLTGTTAGAKVNVADGATATIGDLRFAGSVTHTIEGSGTLALGGSVAVTAERSHTVSVVNLSLAEDTTIDVQTGSLTITSEEISAEGKTLTKTGDGVLTFNTDEVFDFSGSVAVLGGKVKIDGDRNLGIGGTSFFELDNGAKLEFNSDRGLSLTGTDAANRVSANLGKGTIAGNLTIENATLTFDGTTTVEGTFAWTGSNVVTLDTEFRKTITSMPHTLISFTGKSGDEANLKFADVETYGRRSFALDIADTSISLVATGTLVWNGNVSVWTTDAGTEADWTLEQTTGNTTTAFMANDYVEFRDAGSIEIIDEEIRTSGLVFNLSGNFTLNAPTPGEDEEQQTVTLKDALYSDDETTGRSAGLTVVAGNVTIGKHIVNELSSVTVSGGSLSVYNASALGSGIVTIGGGLNDDGTPKSAELFFKSSGSEEDETVTVGQAITLVNNGRIGVDRNTTVTISNALTGGASLTKTGAGTLEIQRNSDVTSVTVNTGTLNLLGEATEALKVKVAVIGGGATLALAGDDVDGGNTAFDSIAFAGNGNMTVTGAFRTQAISVANSATLRGDLYVGADTSFVLGTGNEATTHKGTAVDVANAAGELILTGSVNSYGEEAAALCKLGAGTLKLVASDKTGAFSLDSNVKHLAGTVAFENGGVVSGTYSVADQGVAVVTFSGQNASAFDGGLELGAKSFAWIQNNGSNTLKLNGVSSGESTYVRLSGSNITVSGETANFGSLTEVADDGNVLSVLDIMAENVTVDATTFSAGFVKFADGTTLAIDADTTATANALYVGENVSATLDLRDVNAAGNGAKFSVGTEQAVSVFGGTGTLNVLGGTLELNGVSYGNDAPTVVLNNATLAFAVSKVTDDEGKVVASVANLSNVQTAEGSSGTIAKTGAGTLVILDNNNATDLAFDGKISVSEGDLRMTETASKASVAVEAGATLGFLGAAELADESEARNVLANELSGKGTIAVWGTLYANDANSKFDGTLKAVGGTIYVSSETSDWLKNGAEGAARGIAVSSEYGRGTIATYDEAVTLSAVTLDGSGIFVGADNESALTVERVDATAAGSLTLRGYGTLGAVEFATTGSLTVDSGSEWTLNGEAEGLTSVSVSGTAVVANSKALGTAGVAVGGMLAFDAAGTYTNDLTLSAGAVVKATKDTVLTGTLARSWTGTSNVQFIADGFEVDGEVTGASLTLGESVLDLTGENIALNAVYADSTLAVDVEKTNAFLRATTKLSGAGTFEKKGEGSLKLQSDSGNIGAISVAAGTLELTENAKIAATQGGAGTLSVSDGATLKVSGTKLGGFTLTGDGSAEISGGELAAISEASKVALSGTLSVAGNITDSTIAFDNANAKLTTAGTGEQSVTGTLSGETVTLVNENKGAEVTYDATLDGSVKNLVLTANGGIETGVLTSEFDGSLKKTFDGTWTVTNYTFGTSADQKLSVDAGTLVWQDVRLEAEAGTISIGDAATLKVEGLAAGDTLSATIDGNGTLEIAETGTETSPLVLDMGESQNSKWTLHVSEGSRVKTTDMLPGDLWVNSSTGVASVFDLELASDETVATGTHYNIALGGTLKLSGTGALTLADSGDVKNPHAVSGTVVIEKGSFVQSGNIQWDPNAKVEIGENGTLAVKTTSGVNSNNATISGDGTLSLESTGGSTYRLGGKVSGFAGSVKVDSGATVELGTEVFDGAKSVEVDGTLSLAISSTKADRTLKNISGTGTLSLATPDDYYTRYGVYNYDAANTFAGTVKVLSGVLSVDAEQIGNLAAKIDVGGTKASEYYEGVWAGAEWDGIVNGGFLQVKNNTDFDVASLETGKVELKENAGVIFSGGKFVANKDFGTNKNNLFVVADGATLKVNGGVNIDGDLFVKSGTTLEVNPVTASALRATSSSDNPGISGDLTVNGKVLFRVTDDSVDNGALFGVGGDVVFDQDGKGAAEVELDMTGTTESLENKRVVVFGGNYDRNNGDPNEYVIVTDSTGNKFRLARDANGNLVILNAATEFKSAPSGLQELYNVIREDNSDLWTYLQEDFSQSESRLVALSPVSYGSLVEMQSGFAALENDLLRERLEQRRYERAFASNAQKQFKPFVNIVGAEREGDGNGTKSANYDISHTGVIGGFDVAVSRNTIFGVSLGFDRSEADIHGGIGKNEGNSTRLGVYGMSVFENAYFGYGLSAGATSFDTKRNSGYNGESLTGSTNGNDVNASLIFGAGWTIDENLGLDLAPYVGLDFGYAYAKAFSEEGGKQTALDIEKMERLSLRGKLGATLSWRASDSLRISLDASFSHEFLDSDMDIDAAFASGELAGSSFSSTAYLMDENTISIGPRVDYRIDDTWSVSGGYSYETDLDDTATHSANVGFRARF